MSDPKVPGYPNRHSLLKPVVEPPRPEDPRDAKIRELEAELAERNEQLLTASRRQPESVLSRRHADPPRGESDEPIIINRQGIRIPRWSFVILAPLLVGTGVGAKSLADQAAPSRDAPVIAAYAEQVAGLSAALEIEKARRAKAEARCNDQIAYLFDVLEDAAGIYAKRPEGLPDKRKLKVVAPNTKRGLIVGGRVDVEPDK